MTGPDKDNLTMAETVVQKPAVCTHCGCVCDDLTATIQNQRVTQIENACVLSEDWFLNQTA
ncbi:MAG: hypothetical protein P8M30_00690, partial [Planctomycetaceae bacterium]|nr:hypothetical protein [Planctomycetaceae bacterium]